MTCKFPLYKAERKKELISPAPRVQEKAGAQESACVCGQSRAGAGDDLQLPIHHKGTVALTQPNCPPSEGTDWEEVTLGAPLLQGTLWNNCCSSLPSFLGQVKEINDEKSLSFALSFGEQENKETFSLKGMRRKCRGANLNYLLLSWEMQRGSKSDPQGSWMTGQRAAAAGALGEVVWVCLGLFSKGTHKTIPAAPFPRTRNMGRFRAVQHHSLSASD